MNGMKQGLIIGAIAGLFFGFMLGRYGAEKNTNKAWQQRTTALKKGGKREKNRVVKTGFRGGNKAPSRVAKVKGVGSFKRTFVNIGKAPVTGPSTALVTIVEFSDFECPFCTRGANTIKQVIKEYGNKVRVAFKHQPLSFHKNAHLAAQAAMAAHEQGKFWPYHDLLFKNRRRLQKSSLISYAKVLGLNLAKFKAALDSGKYKAYVTRDSRAGSSIGANGTPTFFINGRKLVGAQPISRFRSIINQEIAIASKLVRAGVKPAQVYAKIVASAPKAPKTRPIPRFVGSRAKFNFTGKEPSWGPKNAKVTIVEFSDFQCPFCNRGAQRIDQIKKNYAGKVRVVFRHLPLSFHRQAHLAAQASMAAHAQGKFWPYHDKLFANYRNLNKANFIKWAKELGLNVAKFKAALDNGTYKSYVDKDMALARSKGASGTPTFFINGRKLVGAQPYNRFKALVDQELSGNAPAPTPSKLVVKKAAPAVKVALGNAPSWGPKNAKVTIVEFSDFQCPFCTRGAKTIDQIKKNYAGKVRVVFKHLPLPFHKQAHLAAQASMAAHAQGKFWPYHDKLFANYRNLNKANFIKWAKELGLNVAKFKAALDNGTYKSYVDKDLASARSAGANGTPTFIVNGQKIVGAQPYSRFKQVIDQILTGKKPAPPAKLSTKGAPAWGPANAKVTIVEFSDFQCPFCNRGANTIKQVKKVYGNKVRVVFKHLPLPFHKQAHIAAQASMAAHAQGKFWPFHDKLFANYRNLSKANFLKWAKELGLNVAKFKADLDSGKYKAYVDKDLSSARTVGANGTPTFLINGQKVVGAQPFARFKQVIDAALSGKKAPAPRRAPRRAPTKKGRKQIPVGASPAWGPKNAKVTIVEFSDFQCPFCNRGANTIKQVKKVYGNKVRVVFKHLPLSFHKNAHMAAQASMAAHAQGKFWPYHDKLFANYRNLSKENYLKWAKELGLDVAKFKAALDSGKYKAYVDKDKSLAGSVGANGTPTFFINGKELGGAQPFFKFKQIIDAELSGKPVQQPTFKLSGKEPVWGAKNAKVTIIEFSDFQCPFCTRGAKTIDQIKKAYAGKVRVVFKHLPLPFHKQAHIAAQASMAAHAQGKFWPFHDKLFANYRNLSKANFLKWAKELGLNVAKFKADLDSGKYKAYVDADLASARTAGANGTPTFLINGQKVVGAQPFARFKQVIDAALSGKKAPAPTRARRPRPKAPTGPVKIIVGAAPTWGPKTAKVTLVEFSDFQCPFCTRGAKTVSQLKKMYGNKLRVVFKHQPLSFHRQAHIAAQASMAAHEQGKFWQFHDKLFANSRNLSKANFLKWAKELGLDVAKFKAALDSGKYKNYVDKDKAFASSVGANGTPTFFINGQKLVGAQPLPRFKAMIDAALSGKKVAAPTAPRRPAPGARVKIAIGKSPVLGSKLAKITIVEFSDFECPFCTRGANTIKKIVKEYGSQVRVVFKHLPLSFHRNAHMAAQASMAAHEQGKFWEFHDKLFANSRNLSKANYLKWAKELGLDVAKFKAALDSGKYKAFVDANAAKASSVGANGTPTFFINGKKLVGAQPFARFKQVIDAELKK